MPQLRDNMTFTAGVGYKLPVSATGQGKDSAVTNVTLLIDGRPVNTLTSAPYEFVLGPLEPGIYTIRAEAHNQHGTLGESYIYKVYFK
jgi:hypothetical protein